MFCDELKIEAIAGNGGDGCISFRREKFVPKGGPDGGDGGNGGDIIIKVNKQLNTLSHLKSRKKYKAQKGISGKGKKMHGKNAAPLIIEVPRGTIIFNEDKTTVYADLNEIDDEFIIAKGGKGGLGNARFVSATHQVPRFAENGEPGEEITIKLELKLVADVGIIGLPSAGKSTLISVISNAKPKIAAYHFTTLIPNLGVVDMSKFGGSANDSFIVADIPGLIEGASEGKGLGHEFLKHISRTCILVHLIDISLENPSENFKLINQELKKFDKNLAKKEQIVAINKIDLINEDILKEKVKNLKKSIKIKKIFQISAITKEGLKDLTFEISKKLVKFRKEKAKEENLAIKEEQIPILEPHLETTKYHVEKIIKKKDYKIFKISGKRIEQVAIMTDINNPEGLERMYHYFDRMGIKRDIEKKGAEFGDFVKIGNKKIPYRP